MCSKIKILSIIIPTVMISSIYSQSNWTIETQNDWQLATAKQSNLEIKDGMASPTAKKAKFQSKLKTYLKKRSASSLVVTQSPIWENWETTKIVLPNLGDAPILLRRGENDYWMFGQYIGIKKQVARQKRRLGSLTPKMEKLLSFVAESTTLKGFDTPLKTTPYPNQFDAPGAFERNGSGYHAWQSKDMINWVHHGAVAVDRAFLCTSAEFVDDKLYMYYDFPNDQDPHLCIDDNLTDGIPGKDMGIAFKDPSDGSDCAIIRDLDGKFHLILEDWSPIDASTHAWDSPLAMHAVSDDGIGNFKILPPAVDERTNPTGIFKEYPHPHWNSMDPKNYPGKKVLVDIPEHRIKAGDIKEFARYEVHEPEQNAFGDWAAISIGGQYYLFCDYDKAGAHGKNSMSVGWFTSTSLDKQFTFCSSVGQGHPDPDIMFAEGKFYLATQTKTDFVSPGPWVETVKVRVGVDTNNNGTINQWTDWQTIKEKYDGISGFSKQVSKESAAIDCSKLPEGYGFQFEICLIDTTENKSKPILDKITLHFE